MVMFDPGDFALDELQGLSQNVERLLNQIGTKSACRGCGAVIWWVKLKSGKNAPITSAALNHFADCPQANMFRKETKPNE